jgi:hypothetical protein
MIHLHRFVWAILPLGLSVWVGYSSGIIRVFDLVHFTHFMKSAEKWQVKVRKDESPFPILATLQEHKGGVYAIVAPQGNSSSELIFRLVRSHARRLRLLPDSSMLGLQLLE